MIPTSAPRANPKPWCIIRKLPNLQHCVVDRFQRRYHAEGYLGILRRYFPAHLHEIVFDPVDSDLPTPGSGEV
jgi:hypothetical protein